MTTAKTNVPLDRHHALPDLAVLYDSTCGWSPDRPFYLELAGPPRQRILDLGCGTGLIADAYAGLGHEVTGVDPAAAMLDVAQSKRHGSRIEWVCADAATFRSAKRFDLIIMTGHAFQVLLSDADVAAALATMRMHLAPTGRVVFESRNPGYDWRAVWDNDTHFQHDGAIVTMNTRFRSMEGDRLAFDILYHLRGRTLTSRSTLRFLSRPDLEQRVSAAGLMIEAVYGDWGKEAFTETSSPEVIIVARAAVEAP